MRFTWDPEKDRANRAKHGIDFAFAQLVFDDPLHRTIADRREGGEMRWKTIGVVESRTILVAHMYEDRGDEEIIRIISARKASRRERLEYEERDE